MSHLQSLELFAQPPETSRLPAGFVASLLFHSLAVFVVSFGVFYVPPLDPRPLHDHLAVRRIALDSPDRPKRHPIFAPARSPLPNKSTEARLKQAAPPLKLHKSRQLLLQPDLPTEADLIHEVPLPTVVVWTAENTPTPEIAPPAAEKPVTANVAPAPDAPNLETELAEASLVPEISASLKLPAVIAATTPIRIHAPGHEEKPPSMSTQAKTPPTPAAVMALGQLQLKHGTAVLPAVNETATESNGTTGLDTHSEEAAAATKALNPPLAETSAADPKLLAPKPADPRAAQAAGAMERAPASSSFEVAEEATHTSQITLARDGQFSAVVVGASIEDQYPELSSVWRGRMAYTVYLHVGLRRSWTLEYAATADDEAAAGGAVTHLEAPWPFSIVRPNLPSGAFNSDALMVHGYVNTDGRFEDLEIAFPADFPEAGFVLKTLAEWQFRPASAEGKPARVEVLLVIPEL
jgi:hypothetical protein